MINITCYVVCLKKNIGKIKWNCCAQVVFIRSPAAVESKYKSMKIAVLKDC